MCRKGSTVTRHRKKGVFTNGQTIVGRFVARSSLFVTRSGAA
ncbi:MAG TPA: hypothetical protein VFN98_01660 [Nitrososphaeraceae archaeon]|nr:hypothetical protein [Nitrososphaeraceae archaeon]